MDSVRTLFGTLGDVQKKIVLAAGAIIVLMILFPPKVIVHTILGQTSSEPAGYHFILSDPAGAEKGDMPSGVPNEIKQAVDQAVSSHIEWGKLLLQIVVVAVVAGALVRFTAKQQPFGARGNSA